MLICLKTFEAETIVGEVFSVTFFKGYVNFLLCFQNEFFCQRSVFE